MFLIFNHDSLNFYTFYRWAMLAITLFNIGNVIVSLLKYKQYFDRLPPFLKQYLQTKTKQILGDKLIENYRDIKINLGLLGLLILLNIVLFLI